MDASTPRAAAVPPPLFEDGLGARRQIPGQPGQSRLEMLCLRRELTAVPGFEAAVRERVSRLANFHHASFGRVHRVDRLTEPHSTLGIVSECPRGARLSEILAGAERRQLRLDVNAALFLVSQLTDAVALLHRNARDVAHGALAPERLVVTPHGQLVVTDHTLGAALEELRYSHERYWKELRIAVPRSAGGPRLDHRADVTQIGIVALSLMLGRLLRPGEYPARLGELVASLSATSSPGGQAGVTAPLRTWLNRALQIDRRGAFTSARDAQSALEQVLASGAYVAAPVSLEAFLGRYEASLEEASTPEAGVPAASYSKYLRGFQPIARDTASDTASPVQGVSAAVVLRRPPAARPVPGVRPVTVPAGPPVERRSDAPGPPAPPPAATPPRRWRRFAALATAVISVAAVAIVAVSRDNGPRTAAGATLGTLVVDSNPQGAEVVIDGEGRGVTPAELSLPPGEHVLELRGEGEPRVIPLKVSAGAQVSQYIELPPAASTPGALQVQTDPPGAQIRVDGRPRGITPRTIDELAPGDHKVVLENDRGSVAQVVTIEPGATASLVVPLTAAMFAPVSGWIAVAAPVEVQLFERGSLLGTSTSDRIMLSAGVHEIELVNETLGYREVRRVEIAPGEVSALAVELPDGLLAVNANPWAEVWVDGKPVGETPTGNLPVQLGPHEVLFRHPALGERRHAVTVTSAEPAHLSVDLSQP